MGCKPGISRASSGLLVFVLVAAGPLGAAQRSAAPGHAMGRAPCAWAEPLRGAGNALDVPATIHTLQDNGFDCVAHVIGAGPPNSFEDFKRLLAAAQPAGISVWPVLLPPSEGTSPPFKADYQGWMKAMAHLSLQYPVLRGVNIDDFLDPPNAKTFNRSYMCSLYQAKQEINPPRLFLPTIYELDQAMADQLAGCVDGVWLWWTNLVGNMGLRTLLENSRLVVAQRFPIYAGVYAGWSDWHQGSPSPVRWQEWRPQVLHGALYTGCRYADGVVVWNLPLSPNSSQNLLLGAARAFAPGGSADLAGKCGVK